jgi:AcrR family transcriptional regulator
MPGPATRSGPATAQTSAQDELLDAAIRHVLRHPRASLAELAAAGGVGRTTLFKSFPTRDELFHAMGVRAFGVVIDRLAPVAEEGGLGELVAALVPVGPQLDFVWRTPAFDEDPAMGELFREFTAQLERVLARAEDAGQVRPGLPKGWAAQLVQSICYVAWQEVDFGAMAPLDAPRHALEALLGGIG